MKNKKRGIEFEGKKIVIVLLICILFAGVVVVTVLNYKSQINKVNKHDKGNKTSVIENFELIYTQDDDCLGYLDTLESIDYDTLKQSDFKDSLMLYNTVYEECKDDKCEDKKPLENYYLVCLTDVSYKNEEKTYPLIDAINEKKLSIESLENELEKKNLSKTFIKETIEYDTTPPKLVLRDVSIESGSTYELDSFVTSCTDDSGEECILNFVDEDMTKYTKVATHYIEISAKDSSGNETKKSARLIINTKRTPKPVVYYCKIIDGKYYDNYGKVVSKAEYNKACIAPEPEKPDPETPTPEPEKPDPDTPETPNPETPDPETPTTPEIPEPETPTTPDNPESEKKEENS